MWPTVGSPIVEIPAGGGRLLKALETLDRLASKWPEPRARPLTETLVDIVLPHVSAALSVSFTQLDLRGNHSSDTTFLTQVFLKSGKWISKFN